MEEYPNIKKATSDVRNKVQNSEIINHPLSSPALAAVVPNWTDALSGFEANTMVSFQEQAMLDQILAVYEQCREWLEQTSKRLDIGTLNEHEPKRVLFMGLFRDLQERFATKKNLNSHKLAILFAGRYTVGK